MWLNVAWADLIVPCRDAVQAVVLVKQVLCLREIGKIIGRNIKILLVDDDVLCDCEPCHVKESRRPAEGKRSNAIVKLFR